MWLTWRANEEQYTYVEQRIAPTLPETLVLRTRHASIALLVVANALCGLGEQSAAIESSGVRDDCMKFLLALRQYYVLVPR